MVSSHLANRLLPHAEPGPVLDLLARHATRFDDAPLNAAPSDQLTEKLVRNAPAEQAAALVKAITSPDLLTRLVGKERRKAVREALAANRHLPVGAAYALAADAEARRDHALLEVLLNEQPPRTQALLLLERPASRVTTNWVETVAYALLNVGDDALLTRAAVELPAHAVRKFLAVLDVREPFAAPGTVLTLALAANLADGDDNAHFARSSVVKTLLADGVDDTVQRRALDELGWTEIRRRLIELIGAGQSTLTVAEVVDGVDSATMGQLLYAVSNARVVVDEALADVIDVADVPAGAHERLRCTSAGSARLAASQNLAVAAVHVLNVPDAVDRLAHADTQLLDLVAPTATQLERLVGNGLADALVVRFARPLVDKYATLGTATRRRLLAAAPDDLLKVMRPGLEDVAQLLARADLRALPETLGRLLLDIPLSDIDRRRIVGCLSAQSQAGWLTISRGKNPPQPGDVTWLVTHAPDPAGLSAELAKSARWDDDPWVAEAVTVLALPWAKVTSKSAHRALAAELHAAFGDDTHAWSTALALLETWHGTIAQLITSTRAVLADAA